MILRSERSGRVFKSLLSHQMIFKFLFLLNIVKNGGYHGEMSMQKILIIGSGGTGKSTLARQLGKILNLPVFHLDRYFWRPNWVQTPHEEWIQQIQQLIEQESWIMDGNYSSTLPQRLQYADTVIFLDFSTIVAMYRVLKRQVVHRKRKRTDITDGCEERLDLTFLKWVWNFRKTRRPKILTLLEENPQINSIHLTSPKKLTHWLRNLNATA